MASFERTKMANRSTESVQLGSNSPHAKSKKNVQKLVWRNIILMSLIHAVAVKTTWMFFTGQIMWQTFIFNLVYFTAGITGVTGGTHRLWSHRAYKAKLPFRIWLMLCQTAAVQNDIYIWARDHRVHHKFTDTDADPHNSRRGFFFSHIGWLMMTKHPDVIKKGNSVDMEDVLADPVVQWQRKYYKVLVLLLTFAIPIYIPMHFWGETLKVSLFTTVARLTYMLNGTWMINSVSHIWGVKPYDKSINATENTVACYIGFGEGFHNYHHIFPWDYKAAEFGNYKVNWTTALIDFGSYIGQVYDMKTVSEDMIRKRAQRTGDGTREYPSTKVKEDDHLEYNNNIWGWDDKDMTEEIKSDVKIECVRK